MISFLWFNTYWLPAMAILGGLIAILWLAGKVASVIERFSTRVARSWHSANSKHGSNFD
ncbi:MAG: hypothetical protein ABF690_00490 [Liquorilactobacillus nagelii]|uniref:hypothetical protein n=1 Tax=Oenococcus sicerae TaxID=2203724 RepID=UPI0039EC9504